MLHTTHAAAWREAQRLGEFAPAGSRTPAMKRSRARTRLRFVLGGAVVLVALVSAASVCAGRGLAVPSAPLVPARCGSQASESLDPHLDSGSRLLRVSCARKGEAFRLVSGRTLSIEFPSVWVLEFEGAYSNVLTGVRGVGCWFRVVDASSGGTVGTGGGPCSQP